MSPKRDVPTAHFKLRDLTTLWVGLGFVPFFYVIKYLDYYFYQHLLVEDGVVEYLTAFCFLVASVLTLFQKPIEIRWINALVVLAFLWVALEEVSYGQRLFGFATSEAMHELNVQSEMNLHNLPWLQGLVIPAGVLMGTALMVYWSLKPHKLAQQWRFLAVPLSVLPFLTWLADLFLLIYLKQLWPTDALYFIEKIDMEAAEFSTAIGCFLWSTRVYK